MARLNPEDIDLSVTHPQLVDEWHPTKNGELKYSDIPKSSTTKVWWQCQTCGHEWEARMTNRVYNHNGCPRCVIRKRKPKHTSFPEKAVYFYLSALFENIVANYKPTWLGEKELDIYIPSFNLAIEYDGQAWHKDAEKDMVKNRLCEQSGVRLIRIREPGCPEIPGECIVLGALTYTDLEEAIKKLSAMLGKQTDVDIYRDRFKIQQMIKDLEYKNSLACRFPHMAEEWHQTKNQGVLPSEVPYSSWLIVHWQCQTCGYEWENTVNSRTANKRTPGGSGCPACAGNRVVPGKNDLATVSPELAKEWHPTKNGSRLPSMVSKSDTRFAWWICLKCGYEWEKSVYSRLISGIRCPSCEDKILIPGKNDFTVTHPEIAAEWHPTKNGNLKPEMLKADDTYHDVWWQCGICATEYQTKVKYHIKSKNGSCPTCRKKNRAETIRKKREARQQTRDA